LNGRLRHDVHPTDASGRETHSFFTTPSYARLTLRSIVIALCALAFVPAAAAVRIPGVVTPSGNIRCLFVPSRTAGPANLLCDIHSSNYAAALQRHCISPPIGLDWHGFRLAKHRKGEIVCTGGILYDVGRQIPHYVTLPYGHTWHKGPFTCTSQRIGLTCHNREGHGLFIARESWRVW
jgi:hypothetical protein